jgi:formate/nitrite transporter FocA (FNT family)
MSTQHPPQEQEAKDEHIPEGEVIYRAIRQDGTHALELSSAELGWSGLAAGLSMGFSMAAEGALHAYLPEAKWSPLVSKLGYSVGFLIVMLGRQQLFTEQTLTAMLPLWSHQKPHGTLGNVARLWAIVLVANLLGAAAFAVAAARSSMFPPELQVAFSRIAADAVAPGGFTVLLRAIPAGVLIATMLWLLPSANGSRLWIIVVLSYVVGIAGSSHVVAGAAECFFLVFAGTRSVIDVFGGYILPAFLGNSIGGVVLVAWLAHAQHAPDEDARVSIDPV